MRNVWKGLIIGAALGALAGVAADRGRDFAAHGAGLASEGIERARSAAKGTIAS